MTRRPVTAATRREARRLLMRWLLDHVRWFGKPKSGEVFSETLRAYLAHLSDLEAARAAKRKKRTS